MNTSIILAVSAVLVFLLTTSAAGASTSCSGNCIGTQVVVCANDRDGSVRQFGNSCAVQQYNCAHGTNHSNHRNSSPSGKMPVVVPGIELDASRLIDRNADH
uniref:Uncharacterized protein n=1 Tax=Timema monikensis TaxID=170555 RepID=A0A7R9EIL7_9NEOP|nr:unnamed protein product [Timema monikensis]